MPELWDGQEYPPIWRVILAFVVAPVAAAVLMAALQPGYDGLSPLESFWKSAWLYAVVGAYPPAIILGIPSYFALRGHVTASIRNCMLVGAALPSLSWGLLAILPSAADEESVGREATVIHGVRTIYGWEQASQLLFVLAALGAAAGAVFWLLAVRWRRSHPIVLAVAAAGIVTGGIVIPRATEDRTCHNPLRDGRTSIGEVAGFNLRVGPDQYPNIASEMEAFERSGGWSVRTDVRTDPSFQWLQISVCKQAGTDITVQSMPDLDEVTFSVIQPQGGSAWIPDFRALYIRISARWPGKVVFQDNQGRETGAPQWASDHQRA